MDLDLKKGSVVVRFKAIWCSACKASVKTFVTSKKKFAGEVETAEVDVEQDEKTADEYAIQSMPTFVALKDGKEVGRIVGTCTQKALDGLFKSALG